MSGIFDGFVFSSHYANIVVIDPLDESEPDWSLLINNFILLLTSSSFPQARAGVSVLY